MPGPAPSLIAEAAELALWVVGLRLLWLRRSALRESLPGLLRPWEGAPSDFVIFLACGVLGGLVAELLGVQAAKRSGWPAETQLILLNTALHVGALGGLLLHRLALERGNGGPAAAPGRAASSGLVVFLMLLPVLNAAALLWQLALNFLHLPNEAQEVVDLFQRTRSIPAKALLIALAVFVAPATEEILFRGGLFRYLRTRTPRPVALGLPAVLFGALHVNWSTLEGLSAFLPLTLLGILLSLAYERTGRIGTVIAAHALYNLNTVLLLLAGVNL